jgi:hypothetical protein
VNSFNLLQIRPINEYTGEMASSLVEAVGHGDIDVAEHAIHMNWSPCPVVMSAACIIRHFELLKLFRKAWAGCPGSAQLFLSYQIQIIHIYK